MISARLSGSDPAVGYVLKQRHGGLGSLPRYAMTREIQLPARATISGR